ncbi:MAG: class I SAM-dependent rRNA methyltransferase [Gemmatimonadaceae bacterium]|nr:class I SAM-dependent rRNA methyltransferase [Gemmatimonadaceae bacterium]
MALATISTRGARRWDGGHPWVFRSDIVKAPDAPPGAVTVADQRGKTIGTALWSPTSEIALRFVSRTGETELDAEWWTTRLEAAALRRDFPSDVNAYRVVHGEGDGLPSLVVDRYDRWLSMQLLSAGLEAFRPEIIEALVRVLKPHGILARNDASVRAREGLERNVETLMGEVPDAVEVLEHGVRYLAAQRTGQKTGAFLDQRENRVLMGSLARGRALDLFSYHGSFALHLARRADTVEAVDASEHALERASANAALNGLTNISMVHDDAFDALKKRVEAKAQYDTIVIDPPAFAKNKASLDGAVRGYKELFLKGMRLLAPGGVLFAASCSYHLSKTQFLEVVQHAAADSGRRILLRALTAQPLDHPEVVTIPETGYLKGAVLEAGD